jgi:LysR family nitrogen assimilation transcriptional regulator
MNLKQLEYFVRVAELGSFSKAARVLDIAQPALSRQVRALEADLRETLLLRDGRGVRMTPGGQRLFEHGVAILQQVARAREELDASRDEPSGHIVVGMPPSLARLLTVPLIEAFGQRLPRARLALVEGLSAHIAEWVATGRVDVALLYDPEPLAELDTLPLHEEALALVEPAGGPTARATTAPTVTLRELARQPLVVPERAHTFRRRLESQAAQAGVKLHIAWEVSSVPCIIDLVCAGHGCAVLTPSAVATSPRRTELRVRPIVEPPLRTVLSLATSARRRPTPLVTRVLALLRELARVANGGESPQPAERAR